MSIRTTIYMGRKEAIARIKQVEKWVDTNDFLALDTNAGEYDIDIEERD